MSDTGGDALDLRGDGDLDAQIEVARTSEDGFVYFRMVGGRFDAGEGMPAEAAAELQRYSQLVYEVARLKWLEAHPERSAVRGLNKAFDLRLVGIEEGSARPVLKMAIGSYDPRETDGDPTRYFYTARDVVNETIATFAVDGELPGTFPRAALPQLKQIGQTLKDRESIAFAAPRPRGVVEHPPEPAVVTPTVHETLKAIDRAVAAEPEWIELEGVVTELDGAQGTFRLDLFDGNSCVCHLGSQEREVAERVKQVLAADGVTAPDVSVGGAGTRGRGGVVRSLWDVNEIRIIRPAREKALMGKLDALRDLSADWFGPGSRTPGPAALRHAQAVIPRLARAEQPIALGANGDGAVVLEWRRGAVEFSAEIEPDGGMYLLADHTDTDVQQEYEGPWDEERLVRFVETGVIDD